MAIVKAVNSRASIGHAINYITKKEKTEARLIGGYNCNPQFALNEMKATKRAWNKTDGRQYKHFIQSFPKDESITLEEANQIARELVESWSKFKGYEVCYATHKDREHIHTHIIVNSVSYEHGKKFNYSKKELQDMKDLSDNILKRHDKSICKKNKEVTAFEIGAYKTIEKADKVTYKSWVLDIMMAVDKVMYSSISKEDFIKQMNEKGYQVDWIDNRKYIVFIDKDGNRIRDKKLSTTFKVKLSKGDLENEFRKYAKQHSRNDTDEYREYDGSDRYEDKYRSPNQGKRGTQETASNIRSRFNRVSNVGNQYNVSERARKLVNDKQVREQPTEEGRPIIGKQSTDRDRDGQADKKVRRNDRYSR